MRTILDMIFRFAAFSFPYIHSSLLFSLPMLFLWLLIRSHSSLDSICSLTLSISLLFFVWHYSGSFFSVVVCGFHSSLLWLSVCCFLSKTFEASYTMWCLVSTCLSLTLGFLCECMSFVCYWFRFDIVQKKLCCGKICTQYSCKSMPLHSHDWMIACSDQVE